MNFLEWWQFVWGIAFFRSWWFFVYVIVPVVAVAVGWLVFRKKAVTSTEAWSETGRQWRSVGWCGIIVAAVLYFGAALWWVPSQEVVKIGEDKVTMLVAYQTGPGMVFSSKSNIPAVVFIQKHYAWFHPVSVTAIICLFLFLIFVRPGSAMAHQETDLLSEE